MAAFAGYHVTSIDRKIKANENGSERREERNFVELDLTRWAIMAHKDDTGFGRIAADIRSVLKVGHHLIIPSERLVDKPIADSGEAIIKADDPASKVEELLDGLQGVIFFERHNWNPLLLPTAHKMGVRTVCIPMWEWFKGTDPQWQLCDLFICPSTMTLSVVHKFGIKNAVKLPCIIDLKRFPARSIIGPAKLFVHNTGLIDQDDRKGTIDTISAFKKVKRKDIRLLVRLQKEHPLPAHDERITVQLGNLDDPANLYATGEAAIQPSKLEGIGLMVLEAVISGMPVVTLDYPPMNEFVRQEELLVRKRFFKRKSYGSAWFKHAHLRLPDQNDLAAKITWCADNDLWQISQANRRWAESVFAEKALVQVWSDALERLCHNKDAYKD